MEQPSYSVPLEHGAPYEFACTSPGAGSNFALPAAEIIHQRILLQHLRFILTTDANAANRRVVIYYYDGTSYEPKLAMNSVQTAGLSLTYFLRPAEGNEITFVTPDMYGPLFHDMLLEGPVRRFGITIVDKQVGDQLSHIHLFGRCWAQRSE